MLESHVQTGPHWSAQPLAAAYVPRPTSLTSLYHDANRIPYGYVITLLLSLYTCAYLKYIFIGNIKIYGVNLILTEDAEARLLKYESTIRTVLGLDLSTNLIYNSLLENHM